ncbi:TPA: winged helix-turn-helix transcriptional regulator [Candidatus Ventrenecus stercoripullorum]|nr:winged helix-turn-helix transcriptional regulator [Candidatus Ventrenecus stercoripullorum]
MKEQAILNVIRKNRTIKQEEIAHIIGKSLRTVKTRMIEMQEKGLITRKSGKRNGEWEIL